MAKNPLLKAELARWFNGQSQFANLRDMATALGIPFDTLRGYFSGKNPSEANLKRLSEATGLDLHITAQQTKAATAAPSKPDRKHIMYAIRLLEELQFGLARCLTA